MTVAKAVDIAIGLVLLSLVVGLVASGVTEFIAKLMNKRSKDLWSAIEKLVDAPKAADAPKVDPRPSREHSQTPPEGATLTQQLYASPFVNELGRVVSKGQTTIDHVAANDFVRGLLSVVAGDAHGNNRVEALVAGLPQGTPAKSALTELALEADNDISKVTKNLSSWFDEQMGRVSRLYRRWSKIVALFVGIAIAVGANVDIIFVARSLNSSDALRAAADSSASTLVAQCKGKTDDALETCLRTSVKPLENGTSAVALPVGWGNAANRNFDGSNLWLKLLGWLLTAFAAMQGGPFWFDILRRLVGFRSGDSPPSAAPAVAAAAA